jgi:hypothetical protein
LELLLNLLWLLLMVPAFWVWRQARCAQPGCTVHSRRSLLLIACVVLLLFPIISASDDLQAMRPEVEECTSRDVQRHALGCRHTNTPDHSGLVTFLPAPATVMPFVTCLGLATDLPSKPFAAPTRSLHSGRAPPFSFPV